MKVFNNARGLVSSKGGEKKHADGTLARQRARAATDNSLLTLVLCMNSREVPRELTREVLALSSDLHQFGLLPAPVTIKPSERKAVRTLLGHFSDVAAKVHAHEPVQGEALDASLKMHLQNWMEFFPMETVKKLPPSVRMHFDAHFPDLKNGCSAGDLVLFKATFESLKQALSACAR